MPESSGRDATAERTSRRRGGPWWALGLAVLVLLGVGAYQAARTGLALRDAEQSAQQARAQLRDGDLAAVESSLGDLARSARTARTHSDGLLWSLGTRLPVVGDDAAAVRSFAYALDQVGAVGPESVQALRRVADGVRTPEGRFDLEAIASLTPTLTRAAEAAARAEQAVADVEPETLVGPLRSRAQTFRDQVGSLASGAGGAEAAVRLLPAMLGADGPRSYLLVVQNNAEIRATGGLPGSASVLRAVDGRLELGAQGSAGDVQGRPSQLGLEAEPGELETFGPQLLTDFRNANFTPDFPRAAELMAASAESALGQQLDGVVTLDPVTLAQVLQVTGPVGVAGEQLTADNALRRLLFEPYQTLGPDEQDAYFEVAAAALLDALLAADADQVRLAEVLGESAGQRRLLVWSARENEQELLRDYAASGALPTGTERPEVGMYLNDGTMAKMQFFSRHTGRVESLGCDDAGRQLVRVELDVTTEVAEPVSDLAVWVTGSGRAVPRGDSLLVLRILAPEGGELRAVELDDAAVEGVQTEVYGREATGLEIELGPQQTRRVTAVLATAPGDTGDPRLQWTPGMTWEQTSRTADSRCAPGEDPAAAVGTHR